MVQFTAIEATYPCVIILNVQEMCRYQTENLDY